MPRAGGREPSPAPILPLLLESAVQPPLAMLLSVTELGAAGGGRGGGGRAEIMLHSDLTAQVQVYKLSGFFK